MSATSPLVDCTCHLTAGPYGCQLHRPASVGVQDVARIYFGCPNGAHDWLPWCRMDDGTYRTRCIHCSREEAIGEAEER